MSDISIWYVSILVSDVSDISIWYVSILVSDVSDISIWYVSISVSDSVWYICCFVSFDTLSIPKQINITSEGHVVLCFSQTSLTLIFPFHLPSDIFKSEVSEQRCYNRSLFQTTPNCACAWQVREFAYMELSTPCLYTHGGKAVHLEARNNFNVKQCVL